MNGRWWIGPCVILPLACQPVGEAAPTIPESAPEAAQAGPPIGTCIGCDADSLIAHFGLREADTPVRDLPGWATPERVLVLPDPLLISRLEAADLGVELLVPSRTGEEVEMASRADVIVGLYCGSEIIEAARSVRFWQYASAGVEPCVRNPTLRERGILLSNAQRLYGPQLAEHAIALMLTLTRQLHRYAEAQRAGRWVRREPAVVELDGKTMLIVGLGGTGMETARRAHALGMRVIATRRSSREGPPFVDYVGLSDEYVELAREADVVVNAAPLTPETAGMFDAAFFEAMKPTAHFINVARGGSVATDDLVAALRAVQLAGAGLDVTDPEPLPPGHPLWDMDDVIITPHAAGGSDLARERWRTLAVENVRRYVAGERLLSLVDLEAGY